VAAAFPILMLAGVSPSLALNPEQTDILKRAQTSALANTQKLPDFICTQVTHRESSRLNTDSNPLAGITGVSSSMVPTSIPAMNTGSTAGTPGEIEEHLTFFHEKEGYQVIQVDGRKITGIAHLEFLGAISAGEFGSAVHNIFDERSRTLFTWNSTANVRGRRAYVFGFRVPVESGIAVIHRGSGQQIVAAYKGKVYIDQSTMDVVRLSFALDLPVGFPIHSSTTTIEFGPAKIAGNEYMPPVHSEVRMSDATYLFVNRIDFKNYQKFVVESTIHYDGGSSN
jgi:hypothetical protein